MANEAADQRDRSAGISYQELIAQDAVPPPAVLTLENPYQSPTPNSKTLGRTKRGDA